MNRPEDKSSSTPLNEDRDALRWAREFNDVMEKQGQQRLDVGLLVAWFANAMMCGEDTYRWRQEAARPSVAQSSDELAIVHSTLHELVHLKQIKRMMESGIATPHDVQKYENTKEAVWKRAEAVLAATDPLAPSHVAPQGSAASVQSPARDSGAAPASAAPSSKGQITELAEGILEGDENPTAAKIVAKAFLSATERKGVWMEGKRSMPAVAPATQMSVQDRHIYIMDKDGYWFHFEPKNGSVDGGTKE